MCGIFARINPRTRPLATDECREAVRLLTHRGPDAQGEYVSPEQDVYLGFRRLSILDLSAASNQPMANMHGNYLIFNGEIYNYRELRTQLQSLGHRFHTTGDTEVLLCALETWGEDALRRLEGMFGFLFWNTRRKEALVARDFLGIKPLYIWEPPAGGFCVASEIKAFYALSDFEPDIDEGTFPEYLRFRCLSSGATLLKNVSQLQAGELLRYSSASDRLTLSRYWTPVQTLGAFHLKGNPVEQVYECFRGTVDRHLLSDVPVGSQLSGGVDSTLSLAVARKDLGRNMAAFHCRVEEGASDESPFAAAVAKQLQLEMQTVGLTVETFFSDLLEKLTWHMDEPLGHPNAVGVYLVSALARPQVTVLISGEGADEVFAGYRRYSAFLRHEQLRKLPVAGRILRTLPAMDVKYYRAVKEAARWASQTTDEEILFGLQFVSPAILNILLGPESINRSEEGRRATLETLQVSDPLTRCQVFDLLTYLPPLLLRQDKMSMAASIENRVPFVTPHMVSMGLNLANRWRATRWDEKVILKELLSRYVPKSIVYRKKAGFRIPLTVWLQTPEGKERRAWLEENSFPFSQYLDRRGLQSLLRNYREDDSEAEVIWILLSLGIWLNLFGSKSRVCGASRAASGTHPVVVLGREAGTNGLANVPRRAYPHVTGLSDYH